MEDSSVTVIDAAVADAPVVDAEIPDAEVPDAEPPAEVTVTFRQGQNGYGGTVDTYIDANDSESSFGGEDLLEWDDDGSDDRQETLLRFDDIFGNGSQKIPSGATILSATLTVVVADEGTTPAGEVREVAIDWDEATTWDTFGNEAGVQPGDVGSKVADAPMALGSHDLDVRSSLEAWIADPSSNGGWIFRPGPNNGDRVRIASSEASTSLLRPTLTVTYAPP